MTDSERVARRALACLDLTDLDDGCTEAAVRTLAARAQTPFGNVAAICVWPRFVAAARSVLAPGIRLASVVNFPAGDALPEDVAAEARQALADGADEIDMVIPYAALGSDTPEPVQVAVRLVKTVIDPVPLKAILETGALEGPDQIAAAAELAIAGGADFLKTSTGKIATGATDPAVRILLEAARDAGRPVGVKVSGGVRRLEDAARYLALADAVMGPDWVSSDTFRFGASGLLDQLLAALQGAAPTAEGTDY